MVCGTGTGSVDNSKNKQRSARDNKAVRHEIGSLSFKFAPFEVEFGGNDKLLITKAQTEGH
jgi:hypothetical protein